MKKARLFAIYGAAGAGRSVMPLLREQYAEQNDVECLFVDDAADGSKVNGQRCLTYAQFLAEPSVERRTALCISDPATRRRLASKCAADGIEFLSIIAAQHVRMDDVTIGEGAVFSPFTTVTSNVRIGNHFHCNINSYVEHDCVIGDFVTFAPGVQCNGNVQIGDGAYIGAGAIIRQGGPDAPVRIGARAIIGMGAVVLGNVSPGEVVVGNPARPIRRG